MREELEKLLAAKPFVPFRIKLRDGETIDLTRQLGFAVGQSLMLVAQDRGAALRVKIDDVVSIDELHAIS